MPIQYVEALMEAPCQLVLQIYVISHGQSPGKLQDKLIQIISILSRFATVVFNMADINGVGEDLKFIPKVFAKLFALLAFAVSVCYRVMALVLILWLFSRWNIEQEENFGFNSQQRTIKRAGCIFLGLLLTLIVGLAFVHFHTLYKNKKEEQKRNLFDMYLMFCGWYYTTLICGPILFLPNSKYQNWFMVYQKYFRIDAIVNLTFRNIILLALAVSYEYGHLNINEDLCSSDLIKTYFSQICYYIIVPAGFFHYLMIEITIKFNTFLQKLDIFTTLVHA